MKSNKILVVDLDGTLTRGGEDLIKPSVRASLLTLRNSGWTLILATGRDRLYLMRREDIRDLFDAWVSEAGLSIYLPRSGEYLCLASDSWKYLVKKLKVLPFVEEKENTIAFKSEYLELVKVEAARLGAKAVFKDNKGTIILLPEGVDKAVGVREALRLLDVDGFIAAIGDSEIDLELLEIADFKAAVADADPALKRKADYIASRGDGEGVIEIVQILLSRVV